MLRTTFYETAALQDDLGRWLLYYNFKRLHQGYRDLGCRPIETVDQFLHHV